MKDEYFWNKWTRESISKEMEHVKRKHTSFRAGMCKYLSRWKSEIPVLLDKVNSKMEMTEENVSELEDKSIESIQS